MSYNENVGIISDVIKEFQKRIKRTKINVVLNISFNSKESLIDFMNVIVNKNLDRVELSADAKNKTVKIVC